MPDASSRGGQRASDPPREQAELALDAPLEDGAAQVSGTIDRVVYHDEESGFCVMRVRPEGGRGLVAVLGNTPRVSEGEAITAIGRWQDDPTHGRQLRAEELRISDPTTREGMQRFLGSGLVRGIGAGMAERLVDAFGEDVFEVIEKQPERLREVNGVGSVRSQRIVAAWKEQRRVRDILVFLYAHGIGTARAVRIYRTYGDAAVERIRSDPYCLARDIRGIGFRTADELGERLGIERGALGRLRAGVGHVLREARGEGHCGLPERELVSAARTLLEVDEAEVRKAIDAEVEAGAIVKDDLDGEPACFAAGLHQAEKQAAARLLALAGGRPPWSDLDAGTAIEAVEKEVGLELAPSQKDAIGKALACKLLVLTGGPGVGKTTLVRAILKILSGRALRILLAAPTGRAAKRLSEATGMPASTLHRLLEADPRRGGFKRNEQRPLECDLLVVDECSMVDVPMLNALSRALPTECALLLIGDVDQLPSVGPGQVLRDLIESQALPVVRLREVFRQAAESRIIRCAHDVNEGRMPELESEDESDFYFVAASDPERAAALIQKLVCERIPARFGLDPVRDVQVLAPMHRGRVGTRSLNLELQAALNARGADGPSVERFGWSFAPGDKVMQVENDYDKDVYNGDVGIVSAVESEDAELRVDFDGREVRYDFDELDSLVLAYATSVHKAQGSEYPAVVIPLVTQHYAMLKRNLLYTAITRGKQLVVLVGQRRALSIALESAGVARRWSKLAAWLREAPGPSV